MLKNQSKHPTWVYIASPYQGDVETNTANAREYCRYAIRHSYLPVCPHIYFTRLLNDNDANQRNTGMYLGKQMMLKCSEVWVFGARISEGMKAEIHTAKEHSIPVRYFNSKCQELID